MKRLLAAALLVSAGAPVCAQSVGAGIEAWQQSDYVKAVSIWLPLATNGDPDAQFDLGQAYRLGKGVPTNIGAAKTWFERAASQGHVDAQTTLGLLLFQNGDQAAGLKWLKKAADQGEARAMLVYGTALVNGDGVPQDPILGYALVSGAAGQGLAPAKQTLEQLDQVLSAADRKRALAIALNRPKSPTPTPSAGKAHKKVEQVATAESTPKPAPQADKKAEPAPKADEPKKAEQVASAEPAAEAHPAAADQPAAKPLRHAQVAEKKPVEAQASAPPSGAWRIQLGAFSQPSNAEAMYKKVSSKGAVSGRKPFYVVAGSVTRLQIGPFESKAAAANACKAVGVACFPVIAK